MKRMTSSTGLALAAKLTVAGAPQVKLLATIKGTALSKDKARVCIQRTDMGEYGFAIGDRYEIHYNTHSIQLVATVKGNRKVSRVTDKRRGVDYQTLDLRFSDYKRYAMFGGADKLNVFISQGIITIRANKKESA